MVLTYHGDNYFKIQSGNFTALIDPNNLRSIKGASLVLNTLKPALAENPDDAEGPIWIENQGEYEVREVDIRGISLGAEKGAGGKEKTAYLIKVDEITIGILGHLSKMPNEEVVELLSGVDLLLIPAGGKPLIGGKEAATLAKSLSPKIIAVPSMGNLKDFLSGLDETKVAPEEKLVLKKKDFADKELEVHILKE